ncbi:MAG: hypothetical protein IPG45_02110 [Deltaproteobacteria bacterium]|nr:hypothetical protein [Deltaproteobacteria bacterium]
MVPKFAVGQRVRFNKRCVLTANVPKNSLGYSHMALIAKEGDKYAGVGHIEPGTQAVVVEYAAHNTGSMENPIVRVNGVLTRVHHQQLDAL